MKKIIDLSLLGFTVLLSCNKSKKLGSDYQSFIGEWKCIDGNDFFYKITKSGYFTFSYGVERSTYFKVSKVTIVEPSLVNNLDWFGLNLTDKTGYVEGGFYFNQTRDTITTQGFVINSLGQMDNSSAKQLYFVRK